MERCFIVLKDLVDPQFVNHYNFLIQAPHAPTIPHSGAAPPATPR
jgi:hypothetical protein